MRSTMKALRALIWITQLGLSVIAPILTFVLLAVWLRNRYALGQWVVWVGVVLGILGTIGALRNCLRTLNHLDDHDDHEPPACGFNDHE